MKKNEPVIIDVKPVVQPELGVAKVPTNPRSAILLGFLVLVVGFGGFLIWSLTAKLDEGVPAQGTVVVDTKRKTIQHQTGGIIESILVRDGDIVKKDQVLIRLIDTQTKAAVDINTHMTTSLKPQIEAIKAQINTLKIQLESLEPQLESLKPLVDEGYFPLNQYLDRRNQYLDKRNQYIDKQNQVLDLQRQYHDAVDKIKVAREEEERTDIRAPVDGTIMGVSVFTVGGVIQPASKIMDIVPESDKLVLEIQIPTHLIDRIHAGLNADVRFSALNQRTTPILSGIVEWVSPDRFQDPQRPEVTYYTARIQIMPESLQRLNGESLQAGMPADVIIKTGSRTFWNYLAKPIEDRAALSLKER